MNDTFDFGRFGKLFFYECKNYLPLYIKGLIVFSAFIAAMWIATIAFDFSFPDRKEAIAFLYGLAVFLSPYFVYKSVNDRKKGYSYAMVPASTLEKLLSMSLVSFVVVPVAVYAALTMTDAFLYMLSCMGMGRFTGISVYNPFVALAQFDEIPFGNAMLASICSISTGMMFNAIFRKNKIIKTVLFNMAVSFSMVIIGAVVMASFSAETWSEIADFLNNFFEGYTPEEMFALCNTLYNFGYLLAIAVTLVITYFRIKRVNY